VQNAKTLDPVMLGRPVQAFDQLAALLARQVETQMQQTGHRPVAMRIEHAHFTPLRAAAPAQPQITLTRATVQAHMAARYGFTQDDMTPTSDDQPASPTEQRIATALHDAVRRATQTTLMPAATAQPLITARTWQWQAQIQVADSAWQPLNIALDIACCQALEQQVLQLRRTRPAPTPATPKPAAPLHIQLTARLLEKTVSTADVQALRTGSVLPIALGTTTVLINGEALLAATVTEHQGKLHLTAFETLE